MANYYNDSISVLTKSTSGWSVTAELDLRPGKDDPTKSGVPGEEFQLWVVIKGSDTAYVSSIRDRGSDVVNILSTPVVLARIPVPGEPNKMALNWNQSRYMRPRTLKGNNTNGVAVSMDGKWHYVTNGAMNGVARGDVESRLHQSHPVIQRLRWRQRKPGRHGL